VRKESSRICNFVTGLVGAFVKLRKATITFVMSVATVVRPFARNCSDFLTTLHWKMHTEIHPCVSGSGKIILYMKTHAHLQYQRISTFTIFKQSLYRSGQTLRVPGGRGSQISRQPAHESGKFASLTHGPLLPPRKYSWYSFLLEAESTPGHSAASSSQ